KGGSTSNAILDLAYTYDDVGNITKLADSAPLPTGGEIGGRATQNFGYDSLYHLTSASGSFATAKSSQSYALAMQYDEIHNIVKKTQKHLTGSKEEKATTYDWAYAYQQRTHTQPHAPTTIGQREYDYDANGNQLRWQSTENGQRAVLVWDEENRLREVRDSGTTRFTYDDQGERKTKRGQHGTTVYVNQWFTVRNGAIASTHVYAGTSRIATKMGAGSPVGRRPEPADTMTAGTIQNASGLEEFIAGEGEESQTSASTTNAPGANGVAHRSDRANQQASNTSKNPYWTGLK
ncbi:hypothetical protein ACQV5M_19465, partial [Leptospira sp. SA-E8]|uniref:hypothetical protein n=1 Tax=Leptospira sp. SA-E8 TaxID=3422259 RepID=UPI003EBBEEB0